MKILLINSNPVVSRLTALSARKEDIQIDEIQEVTELSSDNYDIVFVDADSWSKDVNDVISENIKAQKKVLFYTQDDKDESDVFDMSILKPFLPSEVSAVIRSIEKRATVETTVKKTEDKHFDILKESSKKEDMLLNLDDNFLDDDLEKKAPLSKNNTLNEKDFNKTLEEAFPLKKDAFDDDLFEEIKKEKVLESPTKKGLFELDLHDDIVLEKELFPRDRKNDVKLEKSGLLDFDLDDSNTFDLNLDLNDEKEEFKIDKLREEPLKVDKNLSISSIKTETVEAKEEKKKETNVNIKTEKEPVVEVETQILDKLEVANIKDILENDNSNDMELSDLMTTPTPIIDSTPKNIEILEKETKVEEIKVKKSKSKKSNDGISSVQSNALIETLSSLPIETIKGLLSGATIKITIKFPKVK